MFMFVRALQHLRRVKAQTIARKKRKSAQLWYARCVFVCVPRAFFTEYIYLKYRREVVYIIKFSVKMHKLLLHIYASFPICAASSYLEAYVRVKCMFIV